MGVFMMEFDETPVSGFTSAAVDTPVVVGVDSRVFTEGVAREDDPKRWRRVNRLAVSFQNAATSKAIRRPKKERTEGLCPMVVPVFLCPAVFLRC